MRFGLRTGGRTASDFPILQEEKVRYAETGHIHMGFVQKLHSFRLQQTDLSVGAAEGKGWRDPSVLPDHPVTGNDARLGVHMKGIPYDPGQAPVPDGFGNLAVGSMKKDSCLYMGTNVNVTVGTVSSGTRFDYDTFISDAVNGATLDITNSCDSTATVLARDLGTLPARISGFTGTVTLSDTSAKSYTMPIDMTQGTNILYNATGCIGSGRLAGAPASGTINATFPTDVPLVKGEYALARFTSGGEALANWTVTLNGQAVAEQQVGKLKVFVVKDTTGLWLKVARSGLTVIFR